MSTLTLILDIRSSPVIDIIIYGPVNFSFEMTKAKTKANTKTHILDIRRSLVGEIMRCSPINFIFQTTKTKTKTKEKTKAKTKTFILDIRSSLVRDIMRRGPVNFTFAKKEGQLFSSYLQQLVKKEATKFQILLHRWILKSRDLYVGICLCVG